MPTTYREQAFFVFIFTSVFKTRLHAEITK